MPVEERTEHDAAVRRTALQDAIRASCMYCHAERPIQPGGAYHEWRNEDGGLEVRTCHAYDIRLLLADEEAE
jgi:hypothetical protein